MTNEINFVDFIRAKSIARVVLFKIKLKDLNGQILGKTLPALATHGRILSSAWKQMSSRLKKAKSPITFSWQPPGAHLQEVIKTFERAFWRAKVYKRNKDKDIA